MSYTLANHASLLHCSGMSVDPRFQPINQWSCGLACIAWNLERQSPKIVVNQSDLIHKFSPYFPKWSQQPGLLERGDILTLLEYLNFPYRRFIHTNKRQEFFDYYAKNSNDYLMGFLFTRKQGQNILNHCMAISVWDGNAATMMDAARYNPQLVQLNWTEIESQLDADILALFV